MATRKRPPKATAKKRAQADKKPASRRTATDAPKASARKPAATAATARAAGRKAKGATPVAKSEKAATAARPARGAAAKGQEKKTAPPPPAPPRGRAAAPAAPAARKRTGPPRTVAVTVGSSVVSKLGTKWQCFDCGARFYDLNRSEPLCPKCGADQRQRPKVTLAPAPAPPPPKKQPRPMAPLLDDEDDGTVRYDEEFDLGVRTDIDDAEEDLFPPGEAEEDDVFGPEEE